MASTHQVFLEVFLILLRKLGFEQGRSNRDRIVLGKGFWMNFSEFRVSSILAQPFGESFIGVVNLFNGCVEILLPPHLRERDK